MNNRILTLINFFILLILQEFIFSNINLGIHANIYIYIMFILLLPTNYSALIVLLLAGVMGLSVDLLSSGILGLNMAACLAMGFARPYVLKMVASSSDTMPDLPAVGHVEIRKVLTYTLILVFIHHAVLFSLESFELSKIPYTFLQIVMSTLASTIVILVSEWLIAPKHR